MRQIKIKNQQRVNKTFYSFHTYMHNLMTFVASANIDEHK